MNDSFLIYTNCIVFGNLHRMYKNLTRQINFVWNIHLELWGKKQLKTMFEDQKVWEFRAESSCFYVFADPIYLCWKILPNPKCKVNLQRNNYSNLFLRDCCVADAEYSALLKSACQYSWNFVHSIPGVFAPSF